MNWRLRMTALRCIHFISGYPKRIIRWLKWLLRITPLHGRHQWFRWFGGLIMLSVDLTPVPLLCSILMDGIKRKSRPMTLHEIETGKSVFGPSMRWDIISIDPGSFPAKKNWTQAYVIFQTINFYSAIPDHTLIHEMVHCWQYEKWGSAYITEALWAQRWGDGYNYGGVERLQQLAAKGLHVFNMEQQADIIEDYYRWKNGLPLQWALNVPGVGELLERYHEDVRR